MMCDLIAGDSRLITLLDLFNLVGQKVFQDNWNRDEAAAIRVGRRSSVDRGAYRRGQHVLKILRHFAESGQVSLIYTDRANLRVPYSQTVGYWLTNIFPDPLGTGEGQIELNDSDILPCVAIVHGLKNWKLASPKAHKTGPKRQFAEYDAELDRIFSEIPIDSKPIEVRSILQSFKGHRPQRETEYRRIEEARERAKVKFRSIGISDNSGRIAVA